MVSIGLMTFTVLGTVDAGRLHETGTGAVWVMPGLLNVAPDVQTCGQTAALRARELVFETVEVEDIDTELPSHMAATGREVVRFEWNAETGELTFDTTAPSAIFSDLAIATAVSSAPFRSCAPG
jgi:hypothetical protein